MRGFPHLRGICLQRPDLDVQRRTDIYKIVGHERGRTSSAPLRTRQYLDTKDFFNRAHREGKAGSHDSLESNPVVSIQVAARVRIDAFRLRPGNRNRKSVVEGKSVSVRVTLGGSQIINKKQN